MGLRVLLNALSNYAHLIISIIIALIMSPFLVHTLGDFFYGVWSIIAAITGYFSLLDMGMNRAIVRYVSKYDSEKNDKALNIFFNTSLMLFSAIGVIIVVAALFISANFDRFLDLGEHAHIAKTVALIAGVDFAFAFPFGAIYAVLIAKQRHTVANKINIINTLLRNFAIYVSLTLSPSLIVLAICNLVFNVGRNWYIVIETRKVAPEIQYHLGLFDRTLIKKIYDYSIYSFAASVSARVINFTDEIVVGHFLEVRDVTFYAIAVNLISYFEKIIWAGASVFVPYISQLDALGKKEDIERSFYLGSRITLLLTLFIFFGLLFLGKPFINVWMGPDYGPRTFPVLLLLAIAKVISSGQSMTVARLFGTSKHKFIGIINSIEAFSNLCLSLVLVRHYGMIGVAMGTLVPCLICNGIALPVYTVKSFQLSVWSFIRNSLVGPISVFAFSTMVVYHIGVTASSFTQVIFQGIWISVVYLTLSIPLCIDRHLFSQLRNKWQRKK